MKKPTPGPWTVESDHQEEVGRHRLRGSAPDCRFIIGEFYKRTDAVLAASAPDLFATLEMIADMQDDPATMRVLARAVIKKAKAA